MFCAISGFLLISGGLLDLRFCRVNLTYFCAPMNLQPAIYFAHSQGITTKAFRAVYARYFAGVDKLFTPYFANIAVDYPLPALKMKALQHQSENGIPVIPQILSKSAPEILSFARSCAALGFGELNWNLGCPYPQVARKKRGSGMLPFPEMVDEILDQVMPHMPLSFSVKCRLGYTKASEIMDLLPVFNRYPVSELTIHARTGKQLYSGKTDPDAFGAALEGFQVPVVYNGDIFTTEDFRNISGLFPGISRFMIGRGILQDPFLPARIKGLPQPGDGRAVLRGFLDDLYFETRREKKDSPSALNAMKEYWTYLMFAFEEPVVVFRRLKKAGSFDDYEDATNEVFAHDSLKIQD